jgi:hypothetical protein
MAAVVAGGVWAVAGAVTNTMLLTTTPASSAAATPRIDFLKFMRGYPD